MYESYTRQALPDRHYRELLGSALCAFNSNNAFIIETILRCDEIEKYNWYELMDKESGRLKGSVREVITSKCGADIYTLFSQIIEMRNRIIHSFQITKDGEQILATKEREEDGGRQFIITEGYLLEFIAKNEKLALLLTAFRDQ